MASEKGHGVKATGLKYFKRAKGRVPYWVADEEAVKAGYPVKTANLSYLADNPAALILRCQRLQAELQAWKRDRSASGIGVPEFDGTWETLFAIYEKDPQSPFNTRLKARTQAAYANTLRRLKGHIGAVRIDECDGRKLMGWFAVWASQEDPNNPRSSYRKLPIGLLTLAVVKAALSFGVFCRYRGCAEFQLVVNQATFPSHPPRNIAPTREQIAAAGQAAIDAGAPSRALTYALQFETTVRQTDIIGEWVDIKDPRPSSILAYGKKWLGPTWQHVDDKLIWRMTHGKTDQTTGARGVYDLSACPMVLAHIQHIPPSMRKGPLIVDERTGLPYLYTAFKRGWNTDFDAAGLPAMFWNRDIRAGGNTEAQDRGARLEDRKAVIGHSRESATTAKVYDRGALEAHRRIMKARIPDAGSK